MEYVLPHLRAELSMAWTQAPISVQNLLDQIPMAAISTKRLTLEPTSLTWQTMCEVQRRLLDVTNGPVGFRTSKAYACGQEREYLFFDGLEELFVRKVEVDARADIHPFLKAARLYLDIIFIHPFVDGNARAARWWFEYLLRTSELSCPDFAALRRLPKEVGVPDAYWNFVRWTALNTISHNTKVCAGA